MGAIFLSSQGLIAVVVSQVTLLTMLGQGRLLLSVLCGQGRQGRQSLLPAVDRIARHRGCLAFYGSLYLGQEESFIAETYPSCPTKAGWRYLP